MNDKRSGGIRWWGRVKTVGALIGYFASKGRYFLLPLLFVLLLAGLLLLLTGGISYVAPFWYTIF